MTENERINGHTISCYIHVDVKLNICESSLQSATKRCLVHPFPAAHKRLSQLIEHRRQRLKQTNPKYQRKWTNIILNFVNKVILWNWKYLVSMVRRAFAVRVTNISLFSHRYRGNALNYLPLVFIWLDAVHCTEYE